MTGLGLDGDGRTVLNGERRSAIMRVVWVVLKPSADHRGALRNQESCYVYAVLLTRW